MSKIIKCKTCGADIASNAKSCPSCGVKNKKPFYKKWWTWAVAIWVIGVAANGGSSSNTSGSASVIDTSTANNSSSNVSSKTSSNTPNKVTNNYEKKEDSATVGERAALDKSKSYLSIMYFSKEGLRDQLEYEGFTTKEIDYAIKNQKVDWKEQALGKGNQYMDSMSFSKSGLKEQLIYEGFTDEQASYAVNKIF